MGPQSALCSETNIPHLLIETPYLINTRVCLRLYYSCITGSSCSSFDQPQNWGSSLPQLSSVCESLPYSASSWYCFISTCGMFCTMVLHCCLILPGKLFQFSSILDTLQFHVVHKLQKHASTLVLRSIMTILNRVGPDTEPSGTP